MARWWIQAVAGGLAALLLAVPALAQTKPTPAAFARSFVRPGLASDAIRLEATLKAEAGGSLAPAAQSRRKGEGLLEADKPAEALAPLAAAVAADPGDPANWRAYARAAEAAAGETEENDYQGRTRLRGQALAAAYRAYERARSAPDAATALALRREAQGRGQA